ncbi:hypothetical protein [Amycolatopsis sp. GM8]|uniref:hypothetical protein n=1 Tax=Amycolatopsis sp. GM8 TaxID=2896530 RepID=UPI001F3A6A1E|nr:hypothetical protein [Amycolatopsis sp. GM8]
MIHQAQAERAAALAELANTPEEKRITDAEVYAMIDSLGDVATVLTAKKLPTLEWLYRRLDLELRYKPKERTVDVTVRPRVVSACVRGGVAR